jgi:hypothetical protein
MLYGPKFYLHHARLSLVAGKYGAAHAYLKRALALAGKQGNKSLQGYILQALRHTYSLPR